MHRFLGVLHLALSSATVALFLFRMFGRTSVGWLSNFKDYFLPSHNRAKIPHPCLTALNMVRRARWLNISAFWLISIRLLNSQAVQIEFTDNMCSLEESNRKRTLAQIPPTNVKIGTCVHIQRSEAVDELLIIPQAYVVSSRVGGWYLRVPNKQQNTYSIHTCMMNTLAIPLLTWNYPTQE